MLIICFGKVSFSVCFWYFLFGRDLLIVLPKFTTNSYYDSNWFAIMILVPQHKQVTFNVKKVFPQIRFQFSDRYRKEFAYI